MSSPQHSSYIGDLTEGFLYNQIAMQSLLHKEENQTKLSCSRHFEYFREDLKYTSLETGRSMRTLATSLLLCCKCRLFCKSYLVKSPFILALSTKTTIAVKLWMSSLDILLFIIIIMQSSVSQGKTLPFLHILTQTVCWGVHERFIFFILFCC